MAANNINIGYHVNKKSATSPSKAFKTTLDAIKFAHETHKIKSIQIFSHVNRSGVPMKLQFDEIKKYVKDNGIELFTHGSYVSITIYKGVRVDRLSSELDSAKKLGAKGVVIHINKYTPEQIIKTLKDNRKEWEKYKIPILIENSAYTAKKTSEYSYNSIDKLNNLYSKLSKEFPKSYVMGCVDTAHMFSAGVNPEDWTKLKLNNIKLIHFNGSEKALGSGVDKHAIPFYRKLNNDSKLVDDNIDKKYLLAFAKHCRDIPMVMEANRGETTELVKALNIIRKL